MNNKLNDLMSALEEAKKLTQAEIEQKQQLEVAIKENQNTIERLKAKMSGFEGNGPNPGMYKNHQSVKSTYVRTSNLYYISLIKFNR